MYFKDYNFSCRIASWSFLFQLCCKHFVQETVGKEKFPTISACLAALLNCWVSASVVFFFRSFLPATEAAVFLKTCSCSVFYADPPRAVPVYAHSSQSRRRLIKAYIPTYILSDLRRSRLSLRSGALSLTQTAPLLQSSVVDFCCRA